MKAREGAKARDGTNAEPRSSGRGDAANDALAVRPPAYGVELADRVPPAAMKGATGAELPPHVRTKMEDAFGVDFSSVRVQESSDVSRVGALAYTHGAKIRFAPGHYQPDTPTGLRVLGHELAHVVQQAEGRVRSNAVVGDVAYNNDSGLEREADMLGARAARGELRATVIRPLRAPAASTIQRFEAPVHEASERQGLTSDRAGGRAAQGLSNEESSAVYFGNWMRDLNQVLVPLITRLMPADVAFSAVALMAAKKFGRAMSPEQFGYYIPAEHIDSPAGLTNVDDLLPRPPTIQAPRVPGAIARPDRYVTRSESVAPDSAALPQARPSTLFGVDRTGTAAWIRRTNVHVERRLELAARSGRNPEGMMHFGAALHAVEDLFAHSNWIEIAASKLLHDRPRLMPQLRGAARQIFTYSATQVVRRDRRGAARRPVLLTGSFTGADTQISLTSELTKFLKAPLSPPASAEEARAEDRFVVAVLRTYEAQLRNNPQFATMIRNQLRARHVPDFMIDMIMAAPVADIYEATRIPVPDSVRNVINDLKQPIREFVHDHVTEPLGRRLEAEALNARVADTSLIVFMRQQEQRRTQTLDQISDAERDTMQAVQQVTGQSPEQQNAETQAAASRHAAAVQATPERIVAGPSHSQISKDHPNSPFFGAAFFMASEAVRRLRERMLAAWGSSTPFDFAWTNFPSTTAVPAAERTEAAQNRDLYHATRTQRREHEDESLARGNRIVTQGGDIHVEAGHEAPPFQPYNIAAMRRDSADRIRRVAAGLRAAAGAPGATAGALQHLQQLIGMLNARDERTQRAQQALERAATSVQRSGQTMNSAAGMTQLAARLDSYAGRVENATTLEERWAINELLVSTRNAALVSLASSPALSSGVAASILVVLDDVVTETTPAYSLEQRSVLRGTRLRGHTGPGGALPLVNIDLGDARRAFDSSWHDGRRPDAVVALIREARLLLNHPYESTWWVPLLSAYMTRNQAQLRTDIEARNVGYSTLRRPGEQRE